MLFFGEVEKRLTAIPKGSLVIRERKRILEKQDGLTLPTFQKIRNNFRGFRCFPCLGDVRYRRTISTGVTT